MKPTLFRKWIGIYELTFDATCRVFIITKKTANLWHLKEFGNGKLSINLRSRSECVKYAENLCNNNLIS